MKLVDLRLIKTTYLLAQLLGMALIYSLNLINLLLSLKLL